MFRVLFVGLTLFGAFASVVSYGNNQCITKYERSETDWHKRGFNFTGCQDAEILIKWDKNFKLFFTFGTETSMCIKFKIIVNDGCELNFEGKNEIGDWKWETGETNIRCDKSWCSTHITKNGAIPSSSYYGMSECARNDLRNPIDDEWVWTKIRVKVAEISGQVPILVFVEQPYVGEGEEYFPSTTTTTVESSIETTSANVSETSTPVAQPSSKHPWLIFGCIMMIVVGLSLGVNFLVKTYKHSSLERRFQF